MTINPCVVNGIGDDRWSETAEDQARAMQCSLRNMIERDAVDGAFGHAILVMHGGALRVFQD